MIKVNHFNELFVVLYSCCNINKFFVVFGAKLSGSEIIWTEITGHRITSLSSCSHEVISDPTACKRLSHPLTSFCIRHYPTGSTEFMYFQETNELSN